MSEKFDNIENNEKVNVNVNLKDLEDIYCLKCAELAKDDETLHNIFVQAFVIKRLSAVQSPDGKTKVIPVPIFICSKCGEQVDFENWENKYNTDKIN